MLTQVVKVHQELLHQERVAKSTSFLSNKHRLWAVFVFGWYDYVMNAKGFTILEIVFGIGLFLILLSVVLVNLVDVRGRGDAVAVETEMQRLMVGIEKYHLVCGEYPQPVSNKLNFLANNGCPTPASTTLGTFVDVKDIASGHFYTALSVVSKGDCNAGYVLALQVDEASSLLSGDADAVITEAAFPYPCMGASPFSGDDAMGWYDVVHPSNLSL